MPELPEIEAYIGCLRRVAGDARIERIHIVGPSVLRSVDPPIESLEGARIEGFERLGKRVVIAVDGERFLVLHLMIAGRLRWESVRPPASKRPGPTVAAQILLDRGTLVVTEASKEKRATLSAVAGRAALATHDPGGIDPLSASAEAFAAALTAAPRTLKRALTDPAAFAGIGNTYSDEILHAARLSPTQRVANLDAADTERLRAAAREVLTTFRDRLAGEFATRFPGPGDITAFRPDFAVHGRFGKPCPVCATSVQRIVRGDHETNYCPRCQTGGKVLADLALSRLLKTDWPSRVEDWE